MGGAVRPLERRLDWLITPYIKMRDEAAEHITYQGEIVHTVPDLAARVKACELVLNRVEGVPRQTMQLTGDGARPVLLGVLARLSDEEVDAILAADDALVSSEPSPRAEALAPPQRSPID